MLSTDKQTDRRTDKLTNATKNITSFAKEVTICIQIVDMSLFLISSAESYFQRYDSLWYLL